MSIIHKTDTPLSLELCDMGINSITGLWMRASLNSQSISTFHPMSITHAVCQIVNLNFSFFFFFFGHELTMN